MRINIIIFLSFLIIPIFAKGVTNLSDTVLTTPRFLEFDDGKNWKYSFDLPKTINDGNKIYEFHSVEFSDTVKTKHLELSYSLINYLRGVNYFNKLSFFNKLIGKKTIAYYRIKVLSARGSRGGMYFLFSNYYGYTLKGKKTHKIKIKYISKRFKSNYKIIEKEIIVDYLPKLYYGDVTRFIGKSSSLEEFLYLPDYYIKDAKIDILNELELYGVKNFTNNSITALQNHDLILEQEATTGLLVIKADCINSNDDEYSLIIYRHISLKTLCDEGTCGEASCKVERDINFEITPFKAECYCDEGSTFAEKPNKECISSERCLIDENSEGNVYDCCKDNRNCLNGNQCIYNENKNKKFCTEGCSNDSDCNSGKLVNGEIAYCDLSLEPENNHYFIERGVCKIAKSTCNEEIFGSLDFGENCDILNSICGRGTTCERDSFCSEYKYEDSKLRKVESIPGQIGEPVTSYVPKGICTSSCLSKDDCLAKDPSFEGDCHDFICVKDTCFNGSYDCIGRETVYSPSAYVCSDDENGISVCTNPCDIPENSCSEGKVCKLMYYGHDCQCDYANGYSWESIGYDEYVCNKACERDSAPQCNGEHQQCVASGGEPYCACDEGYYDINTSNEILTCHNLCTGDSAPTCNTENNEICITKRDEYGILYAFCDCPSNYVREEVDNSGIYHCVEKTCSTINCSNHGECIVENDNVVCNCDAGYERVDDTSCFPPICEKDSDCMGFIDGDCCNIMTFESELGETQNIIMRCGKGNSEAYDYGEKCFYDHDCKSNICLEATCTKPCTSSSQCSLEGNVGNNRMCTIIQVTGVTTRIKGYFSYCDAYSLSSETQCSIDTYNSCPTSSFCEHNIIGYPGNESSTVEYFCQKYLSIGNKEDGESCYNDNECKYKCFYGDTSMGNHNGCDWPLGDSRCINDQMIDCTIDSCRNGPAGTCKHKQENEECEHNLACTTGICDITVNDNVKRCRKACVTDLNCNSDELGFYYRKCEPLLPYKGDMNALLNICVDGTP